MVGVRDWNSAAVAHTDFLITGLSWRFDFKGEYLSCEPNGRASTYVIYIA